jgi:hypothetical protein
VEAPLLEASNQLHYGDCRVLGVKPAGYSSQKLLRDGRVSAELCPPVDESLQAVRSGEGEDGLEAEPCTCLGLLCVAYVPEFGDLVNFMSGEI